MISTQPWLCYPCRYVTNYSLKIKILLMYNVTKVSYTFITLIVWTHSKQLLNSTFGVLNFAQLQLISKCKPSLKLLRSYIIYSLITRLTLLCFCSVILLTFDVFVLFTEGYLKLNLFSWTVSAICSFLVIVKSGSD